MKKDEAIKQAKRAVAILKREAIAYAKKNGQYRWRRHSMTTGELMKHLELRGKGWEERSKIKSALTRALKEAAELGFIERLPYTTQADWAYVGPEIKDAVRQHNERVNKGRARLAGDLRVLGISQKVADGAHEPNDRLHIRVKEIRRAANAVRRKAQQ